MTFHINQKIFEQFPELCVGVVVLESLDNTDSNEDITKMMRTSERLVQEKYADVAHAELPEIQCWRKAYKSFGAKGYASSIEALVKRVVKGEQIYNISDLVNLYNALSLKYMLPFGGENLDAMEGDLALTFADGGEECFLLGV